MSNNIQGTHHMFMIIRNNGYGINETLGEVV
jgi:hypothetical protein